MFKSLALPSLTTILGVGVLLAAPPLLPARADSPPASSDGSTPAARPAPTHQQLAELESMATQMETHLAAVQEKIKQAVAKAPPVDSIQAAISDAIAPLPDPHDEQLVLSKLWATVKRHHLTTKSASAAQTVPDHNITELPLHVTLGGEVPDVLALVRELEGPDWAVGVPDLRLSSPDGSGNAEISLSLALLFAEHDTKLAAHVVNPAELPRPAALEQFRQWLSGPAAPGMTDRQAALEQRMEKLIADNTGVLAGINDLDGRTVDWKGLKARAYGAGITRAFPPLYRVLREVSGSMPAGVAVDELWLERKARPDHSVVLTMQISGLVADPSAATALADRLGECSLLEGVSEGPTTSQTQPAPGTTPGTTSGSSHMVRFHIRAAVKPSHDLARAIEATTPPADAGR